jgi:hypothetical protein
MYFFILNAIYVSAITEYIDFVHQFYIFCTKGNSLQISSSLRLQFAIGCSSKAQSVDRHDKTIGLYNC